MGTKNGSTMQFDATSMTLAVAAIYRATREIEARRADIVADYKAITTDDECLVGDRADRYRDCLSLCSEFSVKIANATDAIRKCAIDQEQKFKLGVDFGRMDTAAREATERANAARKRKLSGT